MVHQAMVILAQGSKVCRHGTAQARRHAVPHSVLKSSLGTPARAYGPGKIMFHKGTRHAGTAKIFEICVVVRVLSISSTNTTIKGSNLFFSCCNYRILDDTAREAGLLLSKGRNSRKMHTVSRTPQRNAACC